MFGTIAKDQYVSNVSIRSNTTAGSLATSSILQPPSNGYPANPPQGPYSVIKYPPFNNTTAAVTFTLTVDSTNLSTGDIVVILFSVVVPGGANTVEVDLPANVYSSFNGSPGITTMDITQFSQFNLTLLYDGSKFINTFEFC